MSRQNQQEELSEAVEAQKLPDGPKSEALCVFRAEVRAEKGKGRTTALVRKPDGTCLLLGVTMLALKGFISDSYTGATVGADSLAALLDVPCIVGAKSAEIFIDKHKARIENAAEVKGRIVGDAPGGIAKGGSRGNRCDDI